GVVFSEVHGGQFVGDVRGPALARHLGGEAVDVGLEVGAGVLGVPAARGGGPAGVEERELAGGGVLLGGDAGGGEQADAAPLRAGAVEGADRHRVRQDALAVAVHVDDVEVQPVGLVDVLVLTAGAGAGVEERVGQLPVVADGDRHLGAVGQHVVGHADVLRVGVDHPLERGAVGVLGLGQQDAGVGGEGVAAHPVDDLDGVVVVAAAVAERVGVGVAGGALVAGVEGDVDAGQAAGSGLHGAGGHPGDDEAGLAQRLAGQAQHVALVHHLQLDLVAEHVLGAHGRAGGGRDEPAGVRAAGPVEAAPAEHLPDAGVRAAGRVAVRIVVVVGDAHDVAQLVGVDRHAGALGLDRVDAEAGVGPECGAGLPGGPLDVAGPGPVGQAGVALGAPLAGHVLLSRKFHHSELLPGGRLVLAGAQVEDEVELVGDLLADVGQPGGVAVGAQVAVAPVAGGAGGAALELHRVLVVLAGHRVRAEAGQLDAVAPARVLHPVLVDGVAAVELVRGVEEVLVEPGDLVAGDVVRLGAGVAEDGGAAGLGDHERLVGVV